MFISCHPILAPEARVALTLRLVSSLTTEEIARAFLVPVSTIAQRIVRAKRTLTEAHVPFEVPDGPELDARLASVLQVIYLVFNEGYSATAGDDLLRTGLCDDALRLGRILAGLAPKEPEVHGLVALMEIQASRSRARVGPSGEIVLLLDQDRARWDPLLIHRGLAALERAEQLGGALGPVCAAGIDRRLSRASARRRRTRIGRASSRFTTRWRSSRRRRSWSSIARSRSRWPSVPRPASRSSMALAAEPSLKGYHFLPSVRGDLLEKLGRSGRSACRVRTCRVAHAERARARAAPAIVRPLARVDATVKNGSVGGPFKR